MPSYLSHASFEGLINWLSLRDYKLAKSQATIDVISRYSRGNVMVQNGSIMDHADLTELSTDADRAIEELVKAAQSQ